MSPKKANSAAQNNESTSELIEDKKKLMALIDRAQDGGQGRSAGTEEGAR